MLTIRQIKLFVYLLRRHSDDLSVRGGVGLVPAQLCAPEPGDSVRRGGLHDHLGVYRREYHADVLGVIFIYSTFVRVSPSCVYTSRCSTCGRAFGSFQISPSSVFSLFSLIRWGRMTLAR